MSLLVKAYLNIKDLKEAVTGKEYDIVPHIGQGNVIIKDENGLLGFDIKPTNIDRFFMVRWINISGETHEITTHQIDIRCDVETYEKLVEAIGDSKIHVY